MSKDLVGKKIAVRSGGLDSAMLLIAFKKSGVALKDVQIINMNLDDVLAALISGQVDAGATTEPGASIWLNKGVGKIAFRGGKYLAAYAMGHMTDSFMKNDAAAYGSMQAYCKAVWWGRNNLPEAAKILAKEFNTEVKPIADSMQWVIFDPRLKPLAKASELELAVSMKDEGRIRKLPDFDKYHDAALIKRCEKEHPEWFTDLDDYAKRKAQM
jgi:ABC-type nitrate/sulfonate/bicarbonate transport system substrate-binding protein